VTFAIMILLTCLYWKPPRSTLLTLLAAHLLLQSVFTMGAHLRELRASPSPRAGWLIVPLLALPVALLIPLGADAETTGRDLYLRFLVFYGLLFPSYVLTFIGPWRPARLDRPAALWLGATIVVLLPAYELGFIHGTPWALLAPIIVIVALAVARASRRPGPDNA
jgi:hypothetical protein